jgi:zinc resistance-associated protein
MKKLTLGAMVVALGLTLLGTAAFAGMGGGMGQGLGYGPCTYGAGPGAAKQIDANALRAFQKETLPLRDEVMAKRVEIRNEYAKEKPDQTRIATLQKDIIDLRAKISTAAEKQGLPAGFGQRMAGRGQGWGGHGGRGAGCGNCPMR